VLGDAHPDTADSYVNLGFSFETEGRFDTAEPYFRKALHIRQNAEGVSHAALGLACINVAANCLARERVEEAAGFYEKALLALDHPDCDPSLVQMARDGFDACADEVD
jgi:tetratricopeptide (TPR) repeat protein